MIEKMAKELFNVALILFSFFASFECAVLGLGPLHASCKVDWTLNVDCSTVEGKLVEQIQKWTGNKNCKSGGEKCLYTLSSKSATEIKAVHKTPKKGYKDDLTFTLKQCGNSGCCIHGYSTSETWYAHLDFSTNYCNLRNLIDGAKLNQEPGFTEKTDDSICTQFSSANCDKY